MPRPWQQPHNEGEHIMGAAGRDYDAWEEWFVEALNKQRGGVGDAVQEEFDMLDRIAFYVVCCDLADGTTNGETR